MKLSPHTHLLLTGDSITDCGRARPVGAGEHPALGYGYVAEADALLRVHQPALRIRLTNTGIGGNTIRDLAERWDADVLALAPDWLSVGIGINDVWRQFDPDPAKRAEAVLPDEFVRTYEALLSRTRPQLKGLMLLSPFFIEPQRDVPMRRRMDEYGALVAGLARKHDALFVDTQAVFDRLLEFETPEALAPDKGHPRPVGHLALASALLETLGMPWSPALPRA